MKQKRLPLISFKERLVIAIALTLLVVFYESSVIKTVDTNTIGVHETGLD